MDDFEDKGAATGPALTHAEVEQLLDSHFRKVMPQVQEYTRSLLLESVREALRSTDSSASAQRPSNELRESGLRPVDAMPHKSSRELRLLRDAPAANGYVAACSREGAGDFGTRNAHETTGLMSSLTGSKVYPHLRVRTMQEFLFEAGVPNNLHALFMPIVHVSEYVIRLQEPRREGCLHNLVYSPYFLVLSKLAILFNVYEAAITADYEMVHGEGAETSWIREAKDALLLFFCVELLAKLLTHRLYFFLNDDWAWNLLDFVLILQSATEWIRGFAMRVARPEGSTYSSPTQGEAFTFMRVLRLLKTVKALRVLKFIKTFAELRVMMDTLRNSFISLFWMIIMLLSIFYIFGLICVQGAAQALQRTDLEPDFEVELRKYFGTTFRAMNSMYMAGFGGVQWNFMYEMMNMNGPIYGITFLFYVAFINIVVFNVLTAVFVEHVMELSRPDEDQMAQEWTNQKATTMKEIHTMALQLDTDNSGTISWREFEEYVDDPHSECQFHQQGLDMRSAEMFFRTLQAMADGGEVKIDAFVEGCGRMKGSASSIDLHILSLQVRALQKSLKTVVRQNEMIRQQVDVARQLHLPREPLPGSRLKP